MGNGGASAGDDVEIRDVRGPVELRACQDLQRRAWGLTEDGYLMPVAVMAAAGKMGGLVLGAFRGGQLVAFTFAFLGRLRGEQLVLYSGLTAVEPGLQRGGVGRRLKLAQRERAAAMGLAAVVWAFDPLQAPNARFNLATLGATSRVYEVDLYGPRTDRLNGGLPTDRLLAEWPTTGPVGGHASRRMDAIDLIEAAPVGDAPGAPRRPVRVRGIPAGTPHLQVAIPADLAAAVAADPDLPRAWQAAVREALQAAFGAGYAAVGFARADAANPPCYLLAPVRAGPL